MLLLFVNDVNVSSKNYDKAISLVKKNLTHIAHILFGPDEQIILYGTYPRSFMTDKGRISLSIQRIYLKNAKQTHAILLSSFVPYSHFSLGAHMDFISVSLDELPQLSVDYNIDISIIEKIRTHYRLYWENLADWLCMTFHEISFFSFSHFGKQFMQVKNKDPIHFIQLPT